MATRDEGVVKYVARHRKAPLPLVPGLSQLDHVRTVLWDKGWIGVTQDGIGYGNLSRRLDEERFVVTATSTGHLRFLHHSDYAQVESFDLETNTVDSLGEKPPSSESMTHGAIYRARRRARFVVHIHHAKLFDHLLATGRPNTPEDVPYGTPAMAQAVERLLAEHPADPLLFATRGHPDGVFALGGDLDGILQYIIRTDKEIP